MSFARSQGKCWAVGPGTLCSGLSDWRQESPSTEQHTGKKTKRSSLGLQGPHFSLSLSVVGLGQDVLSDNAELSVKVTAEDA